MWLRWLTPRLRLPRSSGSWLKPRLSWCRPRRRLRLAGRRLAQVVADPSADFDKSGVYWSWSNESGSFENEVSDEVADGDKGQKLWELSEKLVGLA